MATLVRPPAARKSGGGGGGGGGGESCRYRVRASAFSSPGPDPPTHSHSPSPSSSGPDLHSYDHQTLPPFTHSHSPLLPPLPSDLPPLAQTYPLTPSLHLLPLLFLLLPRPPLVYSLTPPLPLLFLLLPRPSLLRPPDGSPPQPVSLAGGLKRGSCQDNHRHSRRFGLYQFGSLVTWKSGNAARTKYQKNCSFHVQFQECISLTGLMRS